MSEHTAGWRRVLRSDRLRRVLAPPGWWVIPPVKHPRCCDPRFWRNRIGTWWVNKIALMGWPKVNRDNPDNGSSAIDA